MRASINLIFAFFLGSFLFLSCQTEKDTLDLPTGDEFTAEVRDQNPDRPPEIPSPDAWINNALLSESISWQEIDHWYRNELPLLRENPDYHNQKSMAISGMVIAKDFLEEAEYDELVFYTKEMIEDDNVLGNVKEMTDMLKRAAVINPKKEKEVAQLSKIAESKFRDHYRARSMEEKEAYEERYHQSFMALISLQYDRWGNQKF